MELIKQKIIKEGRVEGEDILKVDSFLNHQIDVPFIDELGKEFHNRFKGEKIDKIVTIETSGIAIAYGAARYFNVPIVFAKKTESRNIDDDVYESEVFSFTKQKKYKVRISKKYINKGDRVLIIDDFLAAGSAANALLSLISQANAETVGFGIVIEKYFQNGGKILRDRGIRVESLAMIQAFEKGKVIFK